MCLPPFQLKVPTVISSHVIWQDLSTLPPPPPLALILGRPPRAVVTPVQSARNNRKLVTTELNDPLPHIPPSGPVN